MSVNDLKLKLRNNVLRPTAMELFKLFPGLAASFRAHKELDMIRKEAAEFFAQGNPLPEGASQEDFYQAMNKDLISISEYFYQYDYYKLTEAERDEFISRASMRALAMKLRSMYPKDCNGLSRFKQDYLSRFTELGLCRHKWLFVPECTYQQFADLISSVDCIVKPHDGSLGIGVKKVNRMDDPDQIKSFYDKCVKHGMLLEECVKGCEELQVFHPQSLNTIRFVTMAFRGKAVAFGAIFRMGIGDMIIDNVHAGGLCTQVNIETGVVESDGLAVNGSYYVEHPDTHLKIKGTQIPHWDKVVDFCLTAARETKNIITGWDVVVTDKGIVDLIEVNNRPDFDGGMQAPLKKGVKRKVFATLKEVIGKDITI